MYAEPCRPLLDQPYDGPILDRQPNPLDGVHLPEEMTGAARTDAS